MSKRIEYHGNAKTFNLDNVYVFNAFLLAALPSCSSLHAAVIVVCARTFSNRSISRTCTKSELTTRSLTSKCKDIARVFAPYLTLTNMVLIIYACRIYEHVDHAHPWSAPGVPSTCFSLLYKFCVMRLTEKQVEGLIDHCDSPYIRAIGFLFLRFVLNPRDMIEWFEPYFEDSEELTIKKGDTPTYVHHLRQ